MDMEQVKARMQEVQMGATLSGKEMGKVSQMFTVQETKVGRPPYIYITVYSHVHDPHAIYDLRS